MPTRKENICVSYKKIQQSSENNSSSKKFYKSILVFRKDPLLQLFFVLFLLYVFPAQHRATIGSAYAATERREKSKKQGEKMNGSPSPTPFKRIPPWDSLKVPQQLKPSDNV